MPIARFQMPDGRIARFEVPEGTTPEQAQSLISQHLANQQPAGKVGLAEEFKGGAKRMLGSMQTGIAGILNPEEAAKAGQARQEAITERSGVDMSKVGQAYENKGLFAAGKELIGQVPSAIAGQLPNLGVSLAGARTGAMLGAMTGPFAEIGVPVGALAGAFAPSFIQQAGSNLERQAQEGTPISGQAAYGAAAPQAALDVFADKTLFGKLMGIPPAKLGTAAANKIAEQSIKRTLAAGTAKGVLTEMPTEVAQQMLERYQAGLSLTDDDARKEYAATAYQTALLGPLGAVGNIQERSEAKDIVAADNARKAEEARVAAIQAERRATGVMDQQPLFTPEQAPIVERPEVAGPPTEIPEPTTTMPEMAGAPEGQMEMFGPRGGIRPEAIPPKAPKPVAEEAPVEEVPEGTLTPELLKEYKISPTSKLYKAVVGTNISMPTSYNLLAQVADSNSEQGIKANRLLEAYPHLNPFAEQRDLFAGVQNEPETKTEPQQADLFGFPESGLRATTEPLRAEQGMGESVQPETAAPQEVTEPVGRGVVSTSGPISGGNVQPTGSAEPQSNTLDYSKLSYEELLDLAERAKVINDKLDMDAITKHFGKDTADAYAKMSRGQKNKWWDNNATEEFERETSVFQGINEDELDSYLRAVNAFDTESAYDLGRSIALKAKDAIKNGVGSPEYVTVRNALQYAKEQGWNIDEVRKGMYSRATEWAGDDFAELFGDVFGQEPAAPATPPKSVKQLAKEATSASKARNAEPIEYVWDNFDTGIEYSQLSDVARDRVDQYHKANALNQEIADEIAAVERGNKRAEATNAKVAENAEPELSLTETAENLRNIREQSVDKTTAKIEKALQKKGLIQAVRWVQENAPSKSHRIIANFVARRLERLTNAGVNFTFNITEQNGTGLKKPITARGHAEVDFTDPNNQKVDVAIQGSFDENHGLNYRTVLHEAIHAATAASVMLHNNQAKVGKTVPGISEHVLRLQAARDVMLKAASARIDDPTLPDFVKHALVGLESTNSARRNAANYLGVTKLNNAFVSTDEFIAWGLSDPDMQAFLESIQLPNNRTLWSEFVNVIRNLLGVPAKQNTVLSELLSASEALLSPDIGTTVSGLKEVANSAQNKAELSSRNQQIDAQAQAQAQQYINGMSGTIIQRPTTPTPTISQIAQNAANVMVTNPSGAFSMMEEMVNRFRTTVADKNAHVATQIQDANNGAFADVNGQIRADLLLSAKENTGNYIDATFAHGGIDILPNGAIQVVDAEHNVDNIFKAARRLADRIGEAQAKELITSAFYHFRADSIINNVPRADWPSEWIANPAIVPTQAQIQASRDAFKNIPELNEMRKQFIGSKNEVVKFLHKAGFLTDEKAKAFLADDSYAPWFRLKEYQEKLPGIGNAGRMVNLSQMKALVGGTAEVNDMLENMAQMIAWGVRSGISNHTANRALDALTSIGSAKRHAGRPGIGDPSHVVMTYVQGKPTFWTVDNPYDLAAFQTVKGMDSPLVRAVSKAMGTLRAGIVLFPIFPVRQVIMDSQRAFMQAGVDHPYAMVGKIFKSFLSGESFRGTDADIEELRKFGVSANVDFNTHDSTRGMAEKYGFGEQKTGITNWWVKQPAYQFLHKLAFSADQAVRLGIYRQVLEETGDKTLAATKAREIINFQKSGTSELMVTLKQLIPFLGAYLQGMDVNYRSMVGRGNSMKSRKAAAAAYWGNMAMYAGLVSLYAMAMSGDDDYEEQKGYVTDKNFLIPGGGLLPVPPDVGFIAKVIPERITDYILQEATDDPESATRLREGIWQAALTGYSPPAAVYGVTPAIELMTNHSFFSDMPILSDKYKGLEPFKQYTPSTSQLAKDVGAAINFSPIQLDYMFNAIGGTTAGALLQFADVVMSSDKIASDKMPIIGSFQQKPVGGRYTEEYYAVRELTERAYNTATLMQKEGRIEELTAYVANPEIQARLSARDKIELIHSLLNDISEARNAITANNNLTPESRREMVNQLMARQEQILKATGIRELRTRLE